jgi:N6-adenosine-specific RNA methylase IME4
MTALSAPIAPVAGWSAPELLSEHLYADAVPSLSAEEYAALKDDIASDGLQVPLEITAEGVVLDGRARLRVARELGLPRVPTVTVDAEDEVAHMLRRALHRRQLTASQRAALAVKLADVASLREQAQLRQRANLRNRPAGVERASLPAAADPGALSEDAPGRASLPARDGRTRDLVARISGASPRTVQDALTVAEHDPALFDRVAAGALSASTAASKVRRALRDRAIGNAPPLPEGPFALILADPPWSFGSPDSEFAPDQHYPCMPLHEIKQLRIPAADDCVLFMWAVNSLLPEALEVIRAWGFRYRNNLAWVKNGIGPGVWLRQRHELLLIATRGAIGPPDPEERVDSVIEAGRGRHSEKPAEAQRRIEQMYPALSKLELFARGEPRPGWQIWGNQATPTLDNEAEAEQPEQAETKS